MLKFILILVGGFAILTGGFNGAIRLGGDAATVAKYAGGSRDLDLAITFVVTGLVLLALAAILHRLDLLLAWKQED